ncbi:MAG: RHS repeat-associated core domain-containing protein [Synechococcaceae cyanobacterium SM2_3_1]|nr:RHS repeat-associated core domain-containing protein [Synechococcaceae cyanobacterium SM2_3_1]
MESLHQIVDGSGTVAAEYVYAGEMPLLRLEDSSRDYYLRDSIGSVIGLVDENSQLVADFQYDGFGNLRSQSELGIPTETSGDFRFHGQWLEQSTGLYQMRARNYDPISGRFLSRDPAGINLNQPEDLNTYMFSRNNPFFYIDPEGTISFSISELNVCQLINDILQAVKTETVDQLRERAIEGLGESVTSVFLKVMSAYLPTNTIENPLLDNIANNVLGGANTPNGNNWDIFEWMAADAICFVLGDVGETLFFQVPFVGGSGKPFDNGFGCAVAEVGINLANYGGRSSLDYVISQIPPKRIGELGETGKGLLSGDFKYAAKNLYERYVNPGNQDTQWDNAVNFAKRFQWVPANLFLVFIEGAQGGNYEQRVIAKGATDNVITVVVSLQN